MRVAVACWGSSRLIRGGDAVFERRGFFFKQKTAYEIMPGLVGSEMCIRDRMETRTLGLGDVTSVARLVLVVTFASELLIATPVSYTHLTLPTKA